MKKHNLIFSTHAGGEHETGRAFNKSQCRKLQMMRICHFPVSVCRQFCPGSNFSKLGTMECGGRKKFEAQPKFKHHNPINAISTWIFRNKTHTKNDSRARSKSWNNISSAFVFANLCSRWNFRAADIWFSNRQRTFFKPERIVGKKRGKTFPLYIFIISRWKFIDITPVHFALIDMRKKFSSCSSSFTEQTFIREIQLFFHFVIYAIARLLHFKYSLLLGKPRTRCVEC